MNSQGKPMIEHLLTRLSQSQKVNEVILATTVNSTDDYLAKSVSDLGYRVFRGSEEDVMARVLGAAKFSNADAIVEICGDCPLIDPAVVDEVVGVFLTANVDYVANNLEESFPDGMDVRVFSRKALEKSESMTQESLDREHVTRHIILSKEHFSRKNVSAPSDVRWPELHLTLDEQADYQLIDQIFGYFKNKTFGVREIIELLKSKHPEWLEINRLVKRRGLND